MLKTIKYLLLGFSSLALILIIIVLALLHYRPAVPQLKLNEIKQTSLFENNTLSITFLGNTNLLISDGSNSILTDGFFTRPPIWKVLFGKVEPDREIIQSCLDQAGISKLDAVIPVHSHFDHAMDSPIVAELTGAKLIGSESTANIAKGLDFPEEQMIIVQSGSSYQFGSFNVTLIAGKHWPYPSENMREKLLDQDILHSIVPPASVYDYKEGQSYTIIVEHPEATLAIHGSAGFIPNNLGNFDVDILFLGIAGLETMSAEYNDQFQYHVVEALHPEVIVPVHWDDFFQSLEKGLKSRTILEKWLQGMDVQKGFTMVESRNQQRKIAVMPLWDSVQVAILLKSNID